MGRDKMRGGRKVTGAFRCPRSDHLHAPAIEKQRLQRPQPTKTEGRKRGGRDLLTGDPASTATWAFGSLGQNLPQSIVVDIFLAVVTADVSAGQQFHVSTLPRPRSLLL